MLKCRIKFLKNGDSCKKRDNLGKLRVNGQPQARSQGDELGDKYPSRRQKLFILLGFLKKKFAYKNFGCPPSKNFWLHP
jgi:hypothetical protein